MNTFKIKMGAPEMEAVWNDLAARHEQGQLSGHEQKFFKKLVTGISGSQSKA